MYVYAGYTTLESTYKHMNTIIFSGMPLPTKVLHVCCDILLYREDLGHTTIRGTAGVELTWLMNECNTKVAR